MQRYLRADPAMASTSLMPPPDVQSRSRALADMSEEVTRIADLVYKECKDHLAGADIGEDAFVFLCKGIAALCCPPGMVDCHSFASPACLCLVPLGEVEPSPLCPHLAYCSLVRVFASSAPCSGAVTAPAS